jgi:hypothetical protein
MFELSRMVVALWPAMWLILSLKVARVCPKMADPRMHHSVVEFIAPYRESGR